MATDTVSVVAAVLGGFILFYGLTSLVIKERLYISEACKFRLFVCLHNHACSNIGSVVAILCGIIFGPICAHFVDISQWGNEEIVTKEFTRIVIGIQVMAAGVALPKRYLYKELRSLLILLGPVMIWMWLISGLLVWAFIPGLSYVSLFVHVRFRSSNKKYI